MEKKTQAEINIWEMENFNRIVKWIKDFEKNTIQFCFDEKCKDSVTFLIDKSE
jgi:hypothetical protein